jgi:hypothetical protein
MDVLETRPSVLRDTTERWLDVGALCERLLNEDSEIVGIKYFTAKVKGRPVNPHAAQRQQTYLRALATVPRLTIHYGHFMTRTAVRRRTKVRRGQSDFVEVEITEEKGSDVNLASHLLIDGFRARYDLAVVISNDSDLKEPVRFVREDPKPLLAYSILTPTAATDSRQSHCHADPSTSR